MTPSGESKNQKYWRYTKTAFKWGAIGWLTYEVYLGAVYRRQRKRDVFNLALKRQNETGKRLIVVGNPDGGVVNTLMGRDYTCGDLCLDDHGCPKCTNVQTGDLLTLLRQLPTASVVLYMGKGAERIKNFAAVVPELQRVSGGDLFIAHVQPWSLVSWLPGNQQRIFAAPPTGDAIEYKELPWLPGTAERLTLKTLRAYHYE
jgi:hypothetical protein